MRRAGGDTADPAAVDPAGLDASRADAIAASLVRALRNTEITVLYQDRDLKYLWAENVPSVWGTGSIVGLTDADFLPEGEAARLTEAKREALQTGAPKRLEIRIADPDGNRWFDVWIDADGEAPGDVRGIVTTAVETTEQKRREQTLRALLREVSHRSKNLLAIIQSIATQTGRYSGTLPDFLTRFRGRLQSLSSSQDLVTSSNWRGATLRELVESQVARYCADPVRNIRLSGENPFLNPNAALHVGLALHELAVNSVSYGALSTADGHVSISASVDSGSPPGSLMLSWSEQHRPVPAPGEKRFGSVALERVVPASLNSTAALRTETDRLTYQLVLPAESIETT
jgi:two-component sensor histidine kinase